MYQVRIYTLSTAEALGDYATAHWPHHVESLHAYGVTTHGIWTDHDVNAHRLLALISYPDGADPAAINASYMAGSGFAADMKGFDTSNITNVEEILLDPTAASPLS